MKKLSFFLIIFYIVLFNTFAQNKEKLKSDLIVDSPLLGVYFVSLTDGWAVGNDGIIMHTTDGGISWNLQGSNTNQTIEDITFIDKETGFAVGSTNIVLKTTNGGAEWINQNLVIGVVGDYGPNLNCVSFADANNGIIVDGGILRTTNGGSDWEQQNYYNLGINSVSFADSNTGIIVGNSGKIMRTTNSGASWTEQVNVTTEDLYDISFCNSDNGIAVGYNGTIIKTTNGGIDWQKVSSGTSTSLYGIFFIDINNAVTVGNNGIILQTTNGGTTWRAVNSRISDYLYDRYLLKVYFADSNNGFTVGAHGVILKTTDGGKTWFPQTHTKEAPILTQPPNNTVEAEINTTFEWTNKFFEADSYQLQISTDTSFSSFFYNDSTISNKNIELNGLSENTLYYWRVRAKINKVFGNWSGVWKFTTIGKIPYLLSPIDNSTVNPKNLLLQWSNTTNTTEYRLQVSSDSLFNSAKIDENQIAGNSKVVNVDYDAKYFWRIGALNLNGNIYWSDFFEFKTIRGPRNSYFPLEVGDRFYYSACFFPDKGSYGIIKTIIDTLSDGKRKIKLEKYFRDSLSTAYEYWFYDNGKFYTGTDSNNLYEPVFNGFLLRDSCIDLFPTTMCFEIRDSTFFGQKRYCQIYKKYIWTHIESYELNYVTADNVGIYSQSVIRAHYKPSLDSLALTGFVKNGKVTGDTALPNTHNIADLIQPSNNSSGIFNPVMLKWNKVKNAVSYKIQVFGDFDFPIGKVFYDTTITDTSINLSLKNSATHYWRVETKIKNGQELWTPIWNFTTINPYVISSLKYPGNNSEVINQSVTLKWSFALQTMYYRLQISTDSLFSNLIYDDSTLKAKDTLKNINSLLDSTKYFWRVETIIPGGETHWSQTWNFTTISLPSISLPTEFQLYQNYPNPFNPGTKIRYDLPETEHVVLKVFDILGREVVTLVNEEKPAGSYFVKYYGKNLSCGIYFYKIQAGDYSSVKKMILIK